MGERGAKNTSRYDLHRERPTTSANYYNKYENRSTCYDNMLVSDTEDNEHTATDNSSAGGILTDEDRGSVDQVCRCCGAELRGANSLNSLQNSVLYDYFPATKVPANWSETGLDLVGPDDLPQYGKFFQRKLEERLMQVSTHIRLEKDRKQENEKRLENALKENEFLRDHLRRLQTRMHSFQDRIRTGDGTSV